MPVDFAWLWWSWSQTREGVGEGCETLIVTVVLSLFRFGDYKSSELKVGKVGEEMYV